MRTMSNKMLKLPSPAAAFLFWQLIEVPVPYPHKKVWQLWLTKCALSPLNSSYFCHWPSNIPLQYSTLHQHITICNQLLGGYKGFSSVLHALKRLLPPFSSDDSNLPGLALFPSLGTCPTSSSSVIASIPSPPQAFISVCRAQTQHSFLLFFCSLPPLNYSLFLTASNFSWLGEKSNLTNLQLATNFLALSDCTAVLSCCLPPSCCILWEYETKTENCLASTKGKRN